MTAAEYGSPPSLRIVKQEPNVWSIARADSPVADDDLFGDSVLVDDPFADASEQPWERYPLVDAATLAAPITPARWLVKGVWIQRSSGVVAGKKKAFKTWQMHSMAVAVAADKRFLGKFDVVSGGPVVYLTGEGGRDEFSSRHQAIARRYGINPKDMPHLPFHAMFEVAALDNVEFVEALRYHLDAVQPVAVYVDPLYAYHPHDVDVTSVYSRGQMLAQIRAEVEPYAALIIGDHINKSARDNALDLDDIGFTGVSQWADSWSLQRHRDKFRSDGPNSYARLEVLFASRRTGGERYNVDWHLVRDTSDPDVIKWAECDWAVDGHRDVVAARSEQVDATHVWRCILRYLNEGMEMGAGQFYTKTEIIEGVQSQFEIPRRRVQEVFEDRAGKTNGLTSHKQNRRGSDGKVRKFDVWAVETET